VPNETEHLHQTVLAVARRDVAKLRTDLTVQQALDTIRQGGVGEKIVYFYVVDVGDRLMGVLPTRRLLTAALEQRLSDVMIARVVAIPQSATVMEACEAFVLHKFLAFPVVDEQRRIVGVVDVGLLTDQALDAAQPDHTDALFESIGFHVSQLREASPLRVFRIRFPWLLATLGSGMACALLASAFEVTLAKSVVLAFFLTLVLGLAESVGIQSMSVTVQTLRAVPPTLRWYVRTLRREAATAMLLGTACGLLAGGAVWLWRGAGWPALAVGGSITLALGAAGFIGLTVPWLLHTCKWDPKIAAGPLTLALTDLCTLLFYFTLASLLL
jgi:magnesium transporter